MVQLTECPCTRCAKRRANGIDRPLCVCEWCIEQTRARYFATTPRTRDETSEPHPEARPKRWTGEMVKDDLEERLLLVAELERLMPELGPATRDYYQDTILDHSETYSWLELSRLLELLRAGIKSWKEVTTTTREEKEAQALQDYKDFYGPGGKLQ